MWPKPHPQQLSLLRLDPTEFKQTSFAYRHCHMIVILASYPGYLELLVRLHATAYLKW
jgi:hypothetical protein